MGFFRWLFGLEERKLVPREDAPISVIRPAERPSNVEMPKQQAHKPVYRTVARTQETNTYVKDILRKANAKDTTATPYNDNKSDTAEIERLTNRLKAEYSNKK